MLQEDHELPHEPRQSGSFKALQDYVESDGELPLHHLSLEGCNVEFIRQKLQLVESMKKSKLFSIWLKNPLAILLMTSVRACCSFNGLDSDEFIWGSISHFQSVSEPLSFILLTGTRPMVTRSVKAPVSKPQAATASLQKLPLCDKCGTGIVWVQHETAQMVCSLRIYYRFSRKLFYNEWCSCILTTSLNDTVSTTGLQRNGGESSGQVPPSSLFCVLRLWCELEAEGLLFCGGTVVLWSPCSNENDPTWGTWSSYCISHCLEGRKNSEITQLTVEITVDNLYRLPLLALCD